LDYVKKDVFEIQRLTKSYDYIVSNPPYISGYEYNLLDSCVKDYEPGEALTDFGTGLKYFEKIFSIAADKNFNGKVFCEIGFGQKGDIEILLKEKNLIQYFFYKDYSNIDRVLEVIK
jgi:release factor glutamine methyltransferase